MDAAIKYLVFKVFPEAHPEYIKYFNGISLCFCFTAIDEKDSFKQYCQYLKLTPVKQEIAKGITYIKKDLNDLLAESEIISAMIEAVLRDEFWIEANRPINLRKVLEHQAIVFKQTKNY